MNSQPVRQLWLPLVVKGKLGTCDLSAENPTETWGLMERIVAPENLHAAYNRVRRMIRSYLTAGMACGDVYVPRSEGTPQGGPLSPLLANLLLDELDRELEARGHRFVRYADDCNIYVSSRRAGMRVMDSISRYLTERLKLRVNEAKSAVAKPRERSFLGFSIGRNGVVAVSEKARERLKAKVRELTQRNRGCSLRRLIGELASYLTGWKAYFRIATAKRALRELNAWMLRKLRCYLWKQWGSRGYRELRKRGVSRAPATAPHDHTRHMPAWLLFERLVRLRRRNAAQTSRNYTAHALRAPVMALPKPLFTHQRAT